MRATRPTMAQVTYKKIRVAQKVVVNYKVANSYYCCLKYGFTAAAVGLR